MGKPNIIVTNRWIHDYAAEVMNHPHEETGRGIYGIVMDDKTIFVLGLLVPTERDIIRGVSHVKIGGPDMKASIEWLEKNWNWAQKYTRSPIHGHFAFLSSGHSHHTLGVRSYSQTDKTSMLEYIRDDKLLAVVGVLANIEQNKYAFFSPALQPGVVGINRQWGVRLLFYYLDQDMVNNGATEPIAVTPRVIDVKDSPPTPPLGWQHANIAAFNQQKKQLTDWGCTVGINHREFKTNEPLYIQFIIGHPLWTGILNILTPWDYPINPPVIQVLPIPGTVYSPSEFQTVENLKTGPLWNQGDNLIEIIMRLRARGEL